LGKGYLNKGLASIEIAKILNITPETLSRVLKILKTENIEYDKKVVLEIIKMYSPDIRTILQNLQMFKYQLTDNKIKYKLSGINIEPLITSMKQKDFNGIVSFVQNDLPIHDSIYRTLFNNFKTYFLESSIPTAILILDDYMRSSNSVVDKEIHTIAFLVALTDDCSFK
jgi:DNA polymerase III delta prime subunit